MDNTENYMTIAEARMWFKALIKEIPVHKTAPETLKMIHRLERDVTKMNIALFGDGNSRPGIVEKVDSMHDILVELKGAGKFGRFVIYLLLAFGGIFGGCYTFVKFFKDIMN